MESEKNTIELEEVQIIKDESMEEFDNNNPMDFPLDLSKPQIVVCDKELDRSCVNKNAENLKPSVSDGPFHMEPNQVGFKIHTGVQFQFNASMAGKKVYIFVVHTSADYKQEPVHMPGNLLTPVFRICPGFEGTVRRSQIPFAKGKHPGYCVQFPADFTLPVHFDLRYRQRKLWA
jgi:hypothetical protein